MQSLPIEATLPELQRTLRAASGAVLQAPPGAGKTTRVPLVLLSEAWLAGLRIILLEPRRLAARAAAAHMAGLLEERVGDTVGYRMRLDTVISARTRIEVVTEGVLTRMLLEDPSLAGVGLVIFDEFHERSLHADLGLALTLQARALFRPDLRVLVMSATLDTTGVATLLGGAPVLIAEGTAFPVETRYLGRPLGRLEDAVGSAVRRALEQHAGDVLVFLPGGAEIRRARRALESVGANVCVAPLYGDLSREDQERAIKPSPPGWRKVVLATSIAESSLTIEGVRVVIDSGLARVPRFSARTGLSRLETVPVTRAGADQRRGRAGRVASGVCYRLWSEAEHSGLVPQRAPEIRDADLAPLALQLAAWGASDPSELDWLDPPPAAAYAQAVELLTALGALEGAALTPHGQQMAKLAAHPRLAHMLLAARKLNLESIACDLAALLGERDILRRTVGPVDPDVRLRLEVVLLARRAGTRAAYAADGHDVDHGLLHRVLRESEHWRRRVGLSTASADTSRDSPAQRAGKHAGSRPAARGYDPADAGLVLAFAYPDRIAHVRGRGRGRFLLSSGRGAVIEENSALAGEEFVVAAEIDAGGAEARVFLAAPISRGQVERHFAGQIRCEDDVFWDAAARRVRAVRRSTLGAIVLSEKSTADPDQQRMAATFLSGIATEGIDALPWTKEARRLQQRVAFVRRFEPEYWPDLSDTALSTTLEEWLGPFVEGFTSMDDLRSLNLTTILSARLLPGSQAALDRTAPSTWVVPSGSPIPIDYSDPAAPTLAVRLQEVFGLRETPRIGGGRVPLTFRLLSPAQRPVQVTRDLQSFWRSGYFEVRKDLKGRYPKHYWPDDPLTAEPTRRTRPSR